MILRTGTEVRNVIECFLKGTLLQIWKSAYMFVFIWKYYVEDFTLKRFTHWDMCHEICEKFVYKHPEAIEYIKNYPTF